MGVFYSFGFTSLLPRSFFAFSPRCLVAPLLLRSLASPLLRSLPRRFFAGEDPRTGLFPFPSGNSVADVLNNCYPKKLY